MSWLVAIAVAILLGAYIKRRVDAVPDPSREDIAKTITEFIEGTGGEYDWDNFTTYPLKDPNLEKIRRDCDEVCVRFPPRTKTEWCSDAGRDELLRIRDRLLQQV